MCGCVCVCVCVSVCVRMFAGVFVRVGACVRNNFVVSYIFITLIAFHVVTLFSFAFARTRILPFFYHIFSSMDV